MRRDGKERHESQEESFCTTAHSSLHFECIAWACIHTVCCSVAIRVVVGDSTPTYACNNFGAVVGACIDAIIKRIAVGINVSQ